MHVIVFLIIESINGANEPQQVIEMANKDDKLAGKADDNGDRATTLKPYKAPKLQRFGTLSRLTQGSIGAEADGKGSRRTIDDGGGGRK